jgi:DUF4097 and DUF4098 domain-containing protein YvlB
MPVRGEIIGTSFRGHVNAPGGPVMTTRTMMGHVVLVPRGTQPSAAVALRDRPEMRGQVRPAPPEVPKGPSQEGRFAHKIALGDVLVDEVRGDAFIETGAGRVRVGAVFGICSVISGGGPLELGEVHGSLIARTRGGDVIVNAARDGGRLHTDGGIIRVAYGGGPLVLTSGGGDITVRQATNAVHAETKSGDINLAMDTGAKSESITASTQKGNIVLNLPPRYGANVEVTIVTTTPDAHAITSDLQGLSIQREQLPGGKTRIRASGRFNGGGEKMELNAENGSIRIVARTTAAPAKRP